MPRALLQKLAGRVGVAVLLVLLASGSVLAAATTLSAPQAPALLEPADETGSPEATEPAESESPEATEPAESESPEATEAPDVDQDEDADGDAPSRVGMEPDETAPSPSSLARIVERLAAAGIATDVEALDALAGAVGVGGAVRVLMIAEAADMTPAEIVALFDSGKGWGVIVKELALGINPGIGSVMGGGHGPDKIAKAAERAAAKAARAEARAERKAGSGD